MSPRRVLLVDADVKIARLVESTLRLKNVEAIATESGEQAIHALRGVVPDLVISDIALPDLSGHDLLRRVRSLAGLGELPFLFLTNREEAAERLRAKRLKNTTFLRKPFSIDELLALALSVLDDPSSHSEVSGDQFGSLHSGGLPDILRMLLVQRGTGMLVVQPPDVTSSATLFVRDGAVVDGEFGLLEGVDALFGVLLHEKARYAFTVGVSSKRESISEVTLPLLMEAHRLIDEGYLRKIDPSEPSAARMFSHLVASQREPTPLWSNEPPLLPRGGSVEALQGLEEDWDDEGLDTVEFAPGFVTDELGALESQFDDPPPYDDDDDDDDASLGTILISAIDEDNVTAVALIDDTLADLDVAAVFGESSRGDSADVMTFFEALKASALEEVHAYALQLGTRTGRVIASNIPEVVLRDTVASFSQEAIEFASKDPEGTLFAFLDAGDFYVLVVEVDHLRVVTLLFDRRPEPAHVLANIKPHLEEYRASR